MPNVQNALIIMRAKLYDYLDRLSTSPTRSMHTKVRGSRAVIRILDGVAQQRPLTSQDYRDFPVAHQFLSHLIKCTANLSPDYEDTLAILNERNPRRHLPNNSDTFPLPLSI